MKLEERGLPNLFFLVRHSWTFTCSSQHSDSGANDSTFSTNCCPTYRKYTTSLSKLILMKDTGYLITLIELKGVYSFTRSYWERQDQYKTVWMVFVISDRRHSISISISLPLPIPASTSTSIYIYIYISKSISIYIYISLLMWLTKFVFKNYSKCLTSTPKESGWLDNSFNMCHMFSILYISTKELFRCSWRKHYNVFSSVSCMQQHTRPRQS